MTVRLPLRSSADLQVRDLENRIKNAEGLSDQVETVRIEAAKEATEIWEEIEKHEEAINQVSEEVNSFQVKLKEEVIIKPVFVVTEKDEAVTRPEFRIVEDIKVVEKPIFDIQERHEVVIKNNVKEITEIHSINKNIVKLTIGLLSANLIITILEVLWKIL